MAMSSACIRAWDSAATASGQPYSSPYSSRPRSVTRVTVRTTPEAPSQAMASGGNTRLGQPRSRRLNTKPTGTSTTSRARSTHPAIATGSGSTGSTKSRRATYT